MPDLDKVRGYLRSALDELDRADPPPQQPPVVGTFSPADFEAALAKGGGGIIDLPVGFVYAKPLTIAKPVMLRGGGLLESARMTADRPLPRFTAGLTIAADDVVLVGVEVRHTDPLTDILRISGARTTLDRVRVLGDPVHGAKRGIAANGNGGVFIRRSWVDDCFGPYPSPTGNDQQAISAWDMAPGLTIEDNFLRGGSETLMLGGADSATSGRMPSQVVIRKNLITKRPEWQQQAVSVKNTLEIKACSGFTIEDNDIEYSWGGHGQDGYLLMLTVRNQSGRAPWSTIEHGTIVGNRFRHGAAAVNVLARDNNHPSGHLLDVTFHGNTWSDLDPVRYTGSQKLIQIGAGPEQLAFDGDTFQGTGFTSQVYLLGQPQAIDLSFSGITWPKTKYGIFGDAVQVGKAWDKYVARGVLDHNQEV